MRCFREPCAAAGCLPKRGSGNASTLHPAPPSENRACGRPLSLQLKQKPTSGAYLVHILSPKHVFWAGSRSANRPPGLYAPQLGGRIWAGNSLCTTPLGPPDQDPSGVSGSHAPGGLAGCVTANLALFPGRPHEKWGAGKFIFRAIRKTPSEIGLHTRTNGAHQPDDPQRRREKRHGRFRAISEHLPTGAPVRGFEHGQPTCTGPRLALHVAAVFPWAGVGRAGPPGGPRSGPGMPPPTRSPCAHCGPHGLWRCRKSDRT